MYGKHTLDGSGGTQSSSQIAGEFRERASLSRSGVLEEGLVGRAEVVLVDESVV